MAAVGCESCDAWLWYPMAANKQKHGLSGLVKLQLYCNVITLLLNWRGLGRGWHVKIESYF